MVEVPKGIKPGRMGRDRVRSPRHLAYVAEQPCCCCGAKPVEVHHLLRADEQRGGGRRAGDPYAIPLCYEHHRGRDSLHSDGNEARFLSRFCVDGASLAAKLWGESNND
jgi:hypothetical protein